jgi:hypothetical protein
MDEDVQGQLGPLVALGAWPACRLQSICADQSGAGGSWGDRSAGKSYRQLFWLLEPAFSTRIFMGIH